MAQVLCPPEILTAESGPTAEEAAGGVALRSRHVYRGRVARSRLPAPSGLESRRGQKRVGRRKNEKVADRSACGVW